MDLRCEHKKHGELGDGILAIKCRRPQCGAGPGVVVIHRWDALTGEFLDTQRFRDPGTADTTKEGSTYDDAHSVAVWSS